MTIDQIIALAASTGACISGVATLLSVREISKQRQASYRPEIALSSVFLKCFCREGSSIPNFWTNKSDSTKKFEMPLRNIGLGAAKSINIAWDFPFELTIKNLNDLAQRTLTASYFKFENGLLSVESNDIDIGFSSWNAQRVRKIDYVLPVSSSSEEVYLEIPHAYIQLVSAYFYVVAQDENIFTFPVLPPLSLDVEYVDIGDKKHKIRFDIIFEAITLKNHGEEIFASFDVSKYA